MPDNENEPRRVVLNFDENILHQDVAQFVAAQEEAVREIRNRPRRVAGNGLVLDTVGIELESIGLSRDYVSSIVARLVNNLGDNWRVHRDGSSEINVYYTNVGGNRNNRVSISAHTKESHDLFSDRIPASTIGYELISVPMDINTAELSLWALLPALRFNGDFISERCATHVHVGGMKNLGFLKNSLRMGLWFDEVFYSLAHLDGEKFRGYSNNANYARPLINGPYFMYNRNYYQTLNWKRALEAEDLYEFFAAYGINCEGELPKYHPARYFGFNLYSIIRIGTLEFRYFNQSFNPAIVSAIAKLCQLFTELAIKIKERDVIQLEPGNPFETHNSSYYLNKLYSLVSLARSYDCNYLLNLDDIYQLERIIATYKGIGVENIPVITHCRDVEVSGSIIDDGGLIKAKSKPNPSGYVDIHNIKYQSIMKG